jgi:hypothetical protein
MKAVSVTDPITGHTVYTKHPERLQMIREHKRAEQERYWAEQNKPVYWNGDSGVYKMHIPGEVRS